MKQREIKFRAWDKIDEKMLYPKNTQLNYHGESSDIGWTALQYGRYSETKYRIILLQYTGRKDKKGKEIYEGDLIKGQQEGICVVGYDDESASWELFIGEDVIEDLIASEKHYKVIGNIFESPELLNPTNQSVRSHKAKKQK